KVEVVDRRVLRDQAIARGVDARGDRPDDFLPVAQVDVVVADDDELGVHELPQEAPDAEHHALGVPGILLAHAYHGEPVRAAFRRQIKVDDLGELLREQGHEELVQRDAEHRRLVGRLPRIGRVIDRRATHGDALYREHREALDLVVVAGVVAVRAFVGAIAGMYHAFQHDFGARRDLQIAAQAFHELGARAAQQARELVFAERIRDRRHRGKHGRRVGAQRNGHRKRRGRGGELVIAEVERAAALREPAHDDAVSRDDLLAVDAEVLAFLLWPARYGQSPGDERAGVAGP